MKKVWILPLLFIAFLFIRLYFIITFPPFTDESLYIRWGMLMADRPEYRFASIEHLSRQPLAFWLFGFAALVTQSPLIAARLVTLAWNIPSFFLIYLAVKKIYERERALIAVAVLSFAPLFILTQTLALMDGMLFALASILFWIVSHKNRRLTFTECIAVGLLTGISLWIKSTAALLYIAVVLHIILAYKHNAVGAGRLLTDVFTISTISLFCLTPLILRPDFHFVLSESGSFVPHTSLFTELPQLWGRNILSDVSSIILYLGPLILLPAVLQWRRYTIIGIRTAALWFVLPLGIMSLISNSLRFRYVSIGSAGLLPILASGIQAQLASVKSPIITRLYWAGVAGYALFFVVFPVSVFSAFPVTSGERDYALSWPSGYGIPELVRYINNQSESSFMVIAVADSPGNPSDYLLSRFYFSRNVRIVFVTISDVTELKKITPLTQKIPVFLAVRESLVLPAIRPFLKPVIRFEKPQKLDAISLYQLML